MDAPPSQTYEFGDFRLDLEERTVLGPNGRTVPLTPRVFETLRYLVEHAGHVAQKGALMEAVWPDCIVEENNLAQNISTLRRIFGDSHGAHRYIATVPGRGYRFVAQVRSPDEGLEPARPHAEEPAAHSERPARKRAGSIGLVVTLLIIGGSAFLWWRSWIPAPAPRLIPEKSIAVLPFENLSADPDNIYFAEGIKDEILTRLSKIAELKVISRTSTQKFKGAPESVRAIAQQLGVANILEGSVQKSGETVRVTVQLIDAQSDTHLWAESYDRQLTDMFQVETEIAQRIATSLAATLSGTETRALQAKPTASLEAHQAFLKGRYCWNKRTLEGFQQAIEHFRRAIEIDPLYAQAHAGLADAMMFSAWGDPRGPDETLRRSRAALTQALALNDTLADAHASLGLLAMNVDWDWPAAEREFKAAIAADPNYATAHHWYGEFLAYMGRFDEALREVQRAHDLDPLSLIIATDVAKVQALARRYEEAITQFQRALELDPDFPEAQALLGMAFSFAGRHEEAIGALRKIREIESNPAYLAWLGYAYGSAGRKSEGETTLAQLQELAARTYISPLWMATIHTGLGRTEEAFQWLDRVFEERASGGVVSLKVNPLFDPLRSDPRFADFLRRAHLTP